MLLQAKHRVDGATEYCEQEDGGYNRPDNLNGIIAMKLPRLRHIGTLAVTHNRIDQPAFNDYKDNGCYYQDKPEQVRLLDWQRAPAGYSMLGELPQDAIRTEDKSTSGVQLSSVSSHEIMASSLLFS